MPSVEPRWMEEERRKRADAIRSGARADAEFMAALEESLAARAAGERGVPLRQIQAEQRAQRS